MLTEIGTLAADLPVDFMLGRFIGYAGTVCVLVYVYVWMYVMHACFVFTISLRDQNNGLEHLILSFLLLIS